MNGPLYLSQYISLYSHMGTAGDSPPVALNRRGFSYCNLGGRLTAVIPLDFGFIRYEVP